MSGLGFLVKQDWQQTVAFLCFGCMVAAKEAYESYESAASSAAKAADELASKSEQLKSLDAKVTQLQDRMLRYETRR